MGTYNTLFSIDMFLWDSIHWWKAKNKSPTNIIVKIQVHNFLQVNFTLNMIGFKCSFELTPKIQIWDLKFRLLIALLINKIQNLLKIFCLFSLRTSLFYVRSRVDRRVQRILIIIKRYRKENICKVFIFLRLRITINICWTL